MKHVITKELANGKASVGLDKHGCLIIILATKTVLGDLHAHIRLSPKSNSVSGPHHHRRGGYWYGPDIWPRVDYSQEELLRAIEVYRKAIEAMGKVLPPSVEGQVVPAAKLLASARVGNSFAEDTIVGLATMNPHQTVRVFEAADRFLQKVPPPPINDVYSLIENPAASPRAWGRNQFIEYYKGFNSDSLLHHVTGACCESCANKAGFG